MYYNGHFSLILAHCEAPRTSESDEPEAYYYL